jgi:preprotein translocase subunit SecE
MARQGMDNTGAGAPGGGSGGGSGRGGGGGNGDKGGRGGRAPGGGKGRAALPQPARERVGPRQYLSEVRGEMRKVAWPSRTEIINSSIIVLVAVVIMTSLIFGFDYVSAKIVLFLFD